MFHSTTSNTDVWNILCNKEKNRTVSRSVYLFLLFCFAGGFLVKGLRGAIFLGGGF